MYTYTNKYICVYIYLCVYEIYICSFIYIYVCLLYVLVCVLRVRVRVCVHVCNFEDLCRYVRVCPRETYIHMQMHTDTYLST